MIVVSVQSCCRPKPDAGPFPLNCFFDKMSTDKWQRLLVWIGCSLMFLYWKVQLWGCFINLKYSSMMYSKLIFFILDGKVICLCAEAFCFYFTLITFIPSHLTISHHCRMHISWSFINVRWQHSTTSVRKVQF